MSHKLIFTKIITTPPVMTLLTTHGEILVLFMCTELFFSLFFAAKCVNHFDVIKNFQFWQHTITTAPD